MPASVRFFFDYVDPASFVMERRISALTHDLRLEVERVPFELRPPPAALIDVRDVEWRRLWEMARRVAEEEGLVLAQPSFVPWSRKAHELALLAREEERFPALHRALFEAFALEGKDLGRVDVLIALATRHGLERSRAKVALDVDHHADTVNATREEAERLGIRGVPTLLSGERQLQGVPSPRTFLAFLRESAVE